MHVRVDVTRQNEFPDVIDLLPEGRRILFAHRNTLDLAAVHYDRRVRQHFAVGRIDHCRADE